MDHAVRSEVRNDAAPLRLDGCKARETVKGLSMRIVRAWDPTNDVFPCRMDVLYGTATYYGELACRLTN